MEPTAFQTLARHMLSANRIIRAQRAHSQRLRQMILEISSLLHKAAQGPRIGAPRVHEYAQPLCQHVRVDSLAYRAGGIAAAHRERLDQKVRESVQQRYTLRLLTLDQLARAAGLVCALELEREKNTARHGEWPFEIGLWVGKAATPNILGHKGDGRSDSARTKVRQFKADPKSKPSPIPLDDERHLTHARRPALCPANVGLQ
jgi:hypothetical protein